MGFKLNWPAFLISLAIGFAYVYFAAPPLREMVKFPNPSASSKDIYKDDAGECFRFQATKLENCPRDAVAHPVSLSQ
jgi:hypothetical protein